MSERWHRQGTASAHMIALFFCFAKEIKRRIPASKSGVCI